MEPPLLYAAHTVADGCPGGSVDRGPGCRKLSGPTIGTDGALPRRGASDVAARIFAESIGRSLGQQVVVDNLGGGTGLIAAARVLNAPADGYMFFHGSANEVFLAPMLNPAARYKPGDFTLAAPTTDAAIVLLVRSDLPVNTYDEFIAHASQSAGKPLTYATVGVDSMYHLMGEALATRLKLPFLHVPYKGERRRCRMWRAARWTLRFWRTRPVLTAW